MFEFLLNPTPREIVINIARGNLRQIIVFQSDITRHDTIGSALTGVQAALASSAEHLAKRAPDLSSAGLTKEAEGQVDRSIRPAFNLASDATLQARRTLEAETAELYRPKFPEDSVPATRAEQRAWARGLKLPAAIEAAQSDPALASAIIEGGPALAGLPGDVFSRLHRDAAIGQLASILAKQHAFLTVPTADDPVARRPDWKEARRVAAGRFERLDGEREMLDRVPALLSDVVNAVSVMLDTDRESVFKRLTA